MNTPIVILIGFSTTGKSYYRHEIRKKYPDEFLYLDSDEFVSNLFDGHIYNIFMRLGKKKALEYIKDKESEFIAYLSTNTSKPILVAAGPFLVIRDEWEVFMKEKQPFFIHLEKSPESIYEGLLERRNHQKQNQELDKSNPNFGSWDDEVLTTLSDGVYIDLAPNIALNKITEHLSSASGLYKRCNPRKTYDSDLLKANPQKSNDLINEIVSLLKNG